MKRSSRDLYILQIEEWEGINHCLEQPLHFVDPLLLYIGLAVEEALFIFLITRLIERNTKMRGLFRLESQSVRNVGAPLNSVHSLYNDGKLGRFGEDSSEE